MATSRYLIGAAALTTEPFTVAQNELQYRNQTIKTVIILQKITSRAGQLAELEQPAEGKLQLWAAALVPKACERRCTQILQALRNSYLVASSSF